MKEVAKYWKPDIIISESTEFCGRLVAESNNIPIVIISFGMEFSAHMAKYLIGNSLDDFRVNVGLPADPEYKLLLGDLSLCLSFPSFQNPFVPLSYNSHVFKPESFDFFHQDNSLPSWFDKLPNLPIIYVTLGNAFGKLFHIFEKILNDISKESYNIIVTTGKDNENINYLKHKFPNIYIEEYIPQSILIPHVSIVISHGGCGTIMNTLSNGKPMILIPIGADNLYNTQRCFDLGVCEMIKLNNLDPQLIRTKVREILNFNKFESRSTLIQIEMQKTQRIESAIPLIENLFYQNKNLKL